VPQPQSLRRGRSAVSASLRHPAPSFALKDSAGTLHRLEDYAGKWLLLIFHRHLR
jgi:peroxiredoxin